MIWIEAMKANRPKETPVWPGSISRSHEKSLLTDFVESSIEELVHREFTRRGFKFGRAVDTTCVNWTLKLSVCLAVVEPRMFTLS